MTNAPKKKTGLKDLLMRLGPALALILMFIVFAIVMPGKFLRVGNLMNVLKQASINCMIGAGMLLCLITAGIDLSVGYNTTLACCMIGVLLNMGVTSPFILIPVALGVSTFAGFINGTLLTRLELPHPFVSTLGMKNILWGLALLVTGSTSIGLYNKGIDSTLYLGSATIFSFGLPISFILVLVVYAIFHVFLNHTALGRQIYCVGGNAEAARLSGIRSKNVLTIVYTISGFMCGIAGVILAGRVASANPNSGATYDTDAIAACIIGGASFSGGKGTIWGTLIGALLIAIIRNGLNLMGTSNDVQYIVIGAVIILSVTIDVMRGKIEAKARKMAAAE
ncbi:MAG: ABC transporter permease [Clostridia bacterium]|nr:ABC transporter permease [Clostridia bacterium]